MKALGIKTRRDGIDWATANGATRRSAVLTNSDWFSVPNGHRGEGLAWMRKEIIELIRKEQPDKICVRPAEGPRMNVAVLERSQVDGVLLEAITTLRIPCEVKKTATIRADFAARTTAELNATLLILPALTNIAPTARRRSPAIASLSMLPS